FKSRVGFVRRLPAGERLSYGLARELPGECFVATVPAGYADGIPRAYFDKGGEVLVNGRRRLLAGAVTMDQIMLDCGGQVCPKVGDEVVLIGLQGGEEITAEKWASRLGTISYEVLARIGPRVPRLHLRGGTRPSTPVSGL
ncbi:MAG: alanine racemase C-terminal domain-containing protein, partial [Acidimicrobiales bacterium]